MPPGDERVLSLVILAVVDVDRAARFYRAAFGWDAPVATPVYVELALPHGMRLGLYERRAFGRNTGAEPHAVPGGALAPTELYVTAADLDAAEAALEAAGARRLGPRAPRDWGDEAAYFADPDGNVVVVARAIVR